MNARARQRKSEEGQSILEVLVMLVLVFVPVTLLIITMMVGNWSLANAYGDLRSHAMERMIEPKDGWEDYNHEPCVHEEGVSFLLFKPGNVESFDSNVRIYQPNNVDFETGC